VRLYSTSFSAHEAPACYRGTRVRLKTIWAETFAFGGNVALRFLNNAQTASLDPSSNGSWIYYTSDSPFQCRLCGISFPPRTFEPCEMLAFIASAITRTGRRCRFGRMSRRKSTP
jgi:hypothetical protein